MTFRTKLLASTAAIMLATGGTVWADGHATHPVTGESLATEQVLIYSVQDDFSSIDPHLVVDASGAAVVRDLFEGLMNENAEGDLVPGVATGYEVTGNAMTYTFTLRDTARWSNGDPVVAGDFVYGFQRAADPETASANAWYLEVMGIENAREVIAGNLPLKALGVSAPDDSTFVIVIDAPRPYFPQMVTSPTTFPAHRANIELHGEDHTKPGNMVSNGAYVLSEYVPSEKLTRLRNEMYWDNDNTILEQVTALIINNASVALTRYLAGEINFVMDVPAGQFPRLNAEYPNEALSFPNPCSYSYVFNHTEGGPEATKDPRVREALSLAVNRDVIVNSVLAGGQQPSFTFTHWAVKGWEAPDLPIMSMDQDARNARAQELMAEAGYGTDGEPLALEIIFDTSDRHRAIAVAVGQMWKQTLGVETTLTDLEWATFSDTRGSQSFEVARGSWCADFNEPSTYLGLFTSGSGDNDGKWMNADVDALMQEAELADDPMPLYRRVEEIVSQETAIIPIYHYASVRMKDPNLQNWPTENLLQNWYSRDLYFTTDD